MGSNWERCGPSGEAPRACRSPGTSDSGPSAKGLHGKLVREGVVEEESHLCLKGEMYYLFP
jgi:hypothetical protein